MTDPNPATPDEAVAALRDWMANHCHRCGHLKWTHPGHEEGENPRYAIEHGITCWCPGLSQTGSLSRQQGAAVAARAGCTHHCENGHVDADDMVTMEMDAYGRGFDDGAEGRTRFASLEDPTVAGLATVRVGDVARRLHEDRRDSHEGVGTSCPRCMDDARWLLGLGDRDGGQR